ncbi:MAG: PAS domain S-box protein, partial [archaeon]|nr:PAS domain S-box protein [archaeon]
MDDIRDKIDLLSILNTIPEGYVIVLDEKLLWINLTCLKIFGYMEYEKEKVINNPLEFFIIPDEVKKLNRILKLRLSGEKVPNRFETIGKRKDGILIDLELISKSIEIEGKLGFQVLIRDITGRKQIEKSLIESEERFRILSDQSMMGIGIIQKGIFKYINKKFSDFADFPFEKLMNMKIGEYLENIHPEDRGKIIDFVKTLQKVKTDYLENKIIRVLKNNLIIFCDIYFKKIIYEGKNAILVAVIDITKRIQAEKEKISSETKYRNLFNNLINGFALFKNIR